MADPRIALDASSLQGTAYTLTTLSQQVSLAAKLELYDYSGSLDSQDFVNLGLIHLEAGSLERAMGWFNRCRARIEAQASRCEQDKKILGLCSYGLGRIHSARGDAPQALSFLESIKDLELKNQTRFHAEVAYHMGLAHLAAKHPNHALKCFDAAEKLLVEEPTEALYAPLRSAQGLAYLLHAKQKAKKLSTRFEPSYSEGLAKLELARALYPQATREDSLAWVDHRLDMGRAHMLLEQPQDARVELSEALKILRQLPIYRAVSEKLSEVSFYLGKVYLALDEPLKAKVSFVDAKSHAFNEPAILTREFFEARSLCRGELRRFTLFHPEGPKIQAAAPPAPDLPSSPSPSP